MHLTKRVGVCIVLLPSLIIGKAIQIDVLGIGCIPINAINCNRLVARNGVGDRNYVLIISFDVSWLILAPPLCLISLNRRTGYATVALFSVHELAGPRKVTHKLSPRRPRPRAYVKAKNSRFPPHWLEVLATEGESGYFFPTRLPPLLMYNSAMSAQCSSRKAWASVLCYCHRSSKINT